MRAGLKYKGITAMPNSDLYKLLEEASSSKDGKVAQGLRKKAEQCYNACEQRYQRSIGELKFHGWEPKEDK